MSAYDVWERLTGPDQPVFVIAEMSANHGGDFSRAVRIVELAARTGADAIKLQTYTPDTMTIDCDSPSFKIQSGTQWDGRTLYELYTEAATPWEWHAELKRVAEDLGLIFFSTPFDSTAVDFLEHLDVPAFKIASFEMVDLQLVDRVARTGKPLIISTGMATRQEIQEAVKVAQLAGNSRVALLRCTSAYPSPYSEMDLRTIPDMIASFGVPIGLSDHSLGSTAAIAAVALGARLIEKHVMDSDVSPTADSSFSVDANSFSDLVAAVRNTEECLGNVRYGPTAHEAPFLAFRRSLYAVEDIKAGETFKVGNVRAIRPAYGLPPRDLPSILGRRARKDLTRGTPLTADVVDTSDTIGPTPTNQQNLANPDRHSP